MKSKLFLYLISLLNQGWDFFSLNTQVYVYNRTTKLLKTVLVFTYSRENIKERYRTNMTKLKSIQTRKPNTNTLHATNEKHILCTATDDHH